MAGAGAEIGLPKFTTTYETELTDALRALGMTDAFDPNLADFSRMGTSDQGPLAVGGVLLIVLTLLSGSRDYNGSGMELIGRIMGGETVSYLAFFWKMIFTAVVLGAGFKGGEIVPTLCVGAAFGATVARIAGLDQGLCAACSMAALFAGVTNCPIATVILAFELFGYGAMPYFAIIVAVSFTLSGYYGLYKSQKFVYSKLKAEYINIRSK